MKAKTENKEKEFDAVKIIRTIKEGISKDISELNYTELKEYLHKNRIQQSK